jgi:hypothetical protein
MRRMFARIFQASIWAPGAIPPEEHKYRNLKRVILPIYDILIVIGGVSAWRYGVPAIQELFSMWITGIVSVVFTAAGVACFIGVAFPKLASLETAAKIVVIGMLTSYVTALALLLSEGDADRGFISVIAVMAMLLPLWRISLLSGERQKRKIVARRERA